MFTILLDLNSPLPELICGTSSSCKVESFLSTFSSLVSSNFSKSDVYIVFHVKRFTLYEIEKMRVKQMCVWSLASNS